MSAPSDPGDPRKTGGGCGLRVFVPDVTPALVPLLTLLGGSAARPADPVLLLPARWPVLRVTGSGLPSHWQRLPASTLWAAHQGAVAALRAGTPRSGGPSVLTLTRHLARLASSPCCLCSISCGARRLEGETGLCGSGAATRIDRLLLLEGEEPFLGRGLGIYPAGCNALPGCAYCLYPWAIAAEQGEPLSPREVASRIAQARSDGATHTHWIGGNMDQHIPFMMDVLVASRTPLPVVYHTNGTASAEAMALVGPIASVISVDCRHAAAGCARELGAPQLDPEAVKQTLRRAARTGATVVARILGLPGRHLTCCTLPWLDFLAAELKDTVWINLMGHAYTPSHRTVGHSELGRPLSAEERGILDRRVAELGLRRLDAVGGA